jgi:hypothetical protein
MPTRAKICVIFKACSCLSKQARVTGVIGKQNVALSRFRKTISAAKDKVRWNPGAYQMIAAQPRFAPSASYPTINANDSNFG